MDKFKIARLKYKFKKKIYQKIMITHQIQKNNNKINLIPYLLNQKKIKTNNNNKIIAKINHRYKFNNNKVKIIKIWKQNKKNQTKIMKITGKFNNKRRIRKINYN